MPTLRIASRFANRQPGDSLSPRRTLPGRLRWEVDLMYLTDCRQSDNRVKSRTDYKANSGRDVAMRKKKLTYWLMTSGVRARFLFQLLPRQAGSDNGCSIGA